MIRRPHEYIKIWALRNTEICDNISNYTYKKNKRAHTKHKNARMMYQRRTQRGAY